MISIFFVIFYKLNLNSFQNVQNFLKLFFFFKFWNEDISDLYTLYCTPDLKLALFVLPLPLKLALEVNLKENILFKSLIYKRFRLNNF